MCFSPQSGCTLCVWDMYRDALHDFRVQQAVQKGHPPPAKPLDPFEEMELRMKALDEKTKGTQAAETPKAPS